jgi:hypothetical protein
MNAVQVANAEADAEAVRQARAEGQLGTGAAQASDHASASQQENVTRLQLEIDRLQVDLQASSNRDAEIAQLRTQNEDLEADLQVLRAKLAERQHQQLSSTPHLTPATGAALSWLCMSACSVWPMSFQCLSAPRHTSLHKCHGAGL